MKGKTAVVTGGAGGIGLGIARALARAGANIALADIRTDALELARTELAGLGAIARSYVVDMSSRDEVVALADRVAADFGRIDILINNAGVAYPGVPIPEAPPGDIAWIFGVNVFGIINGIQAFVPHMRRAKGGGHIVNTSSLAGLVVFRGWHQGVYAATKMAVVALSEGLRDDLEADGIGVSVLCPAAVATDLYATSASAEVRAASYGATADRIAPVERIALLAQGMHPDEVGSYVVRAILERTFYIITHPEFAGVVAARHGEIMQAFEAYTP